MTIGTYKPPHAIVGARVGLKVSNLAQLSHIHHTFLIRIQKVWLKIQLVYYLHFHKPISVIKFQLECIAFFDTRYIDFDVKMFIFFKLTVLLVWNQKIFGFSTLYLNFKRKILY